MIVGIINYPRFSKDKEVLINESLELAEIIKTKFKQEIVSVTTPDKTYTLGID